MSVKFKTMRRWAWFCFLAAVCWGVPARALAAATNAPPRAPAVTLPGGAVLEASEDWLTFGLNHVRVLDENRLFDQPLWKYVAFLIYVLLACISAKVLDRLVSGRLKRWAARTATRLDDLLLELLHGPIKVVTFVVLLHVGLRLFVWPAWVQDYLSKGLRIVVGWSLTYMVVKGVDLLMEYWRQRVSAEADRAFDEQLFPIIRKTLKAFICLVAILLISQNLGLNINSLLASLSIGGLALGLAAQDTIANLFGAVAILVDKPFRLGDRIKLDAVEGNVESIGLRSTRVRNLDGHLITIPNKTMGGATITNVSRRPNIKTEMDLGITYDASAAKIEQALGILDAVYRGHPATHDVIISFNKFADSALNLNVVHWWKGNDLKGYLAAMQELNLEIKRRFDEAGIGFAFPSQTLYLKQDSDWRFTTGEVGERAG